MIKKFNIIFFLLYLILLFQITDIVFAQDNNIWFGITLTAYSSNKVGMEEYGINVPLGDVVYYLNQNFYYIMIDTDFINFHLLFQNRSIIYGFEFFYETAVIRGYNFTTVIYPSIGGIFGIRPITKKNFLLFQSTISLSLGYLYIDVLNISYSDFNIIVKFSHTLYIKVSKSTYFFTSLTYRYFYFFNKDNPLIIGGASFWFGIEWKV